MFTDPFCVVAPHAAAINLFPLTFTEKHRFTNRWKLECVGDLIALMVRRMAQMVRLKMVRLKRFPSDSLRPP